METRPPRKFNPYLKLPQVQGNPGSFFSLLGPPILRGKTNNHRHGFFWLQAASSWLPSWCLAPCMGHLGLILGTYLGGLAWGRIGPSWRHLGPTGAISDPLWIQLRQFRGTSFSARRHYVKQKAARKTKNGHISATSEVLARNRFWLTPAFNGFTQLRSCSSQSLHSAFTCKLGSHRYVCQAIV